MQSNGIRLDWSWPRAGTQRAGTQRTGVQRADTQRASGRWSSGSPCLFVFPDIIHHSGPDAMQTETGSVHAGPERKTSGKQSFESVSAFESVESVSGGGGGAVTKKYGSPISPSCFDSPFTLHRWLILPGRTGDGLVDPVVCLFSQT